MVTKIITLLVAALLLLPAQGLAQTKIKTTGIADGAITTAKLAGDSVTAGKIVDGAVGTAEIDANAVTASEMADNAIGSAEITDGTVAAGDLSATLDLSGKTVTLAASAAAEPYLEYRDEKAAGTDGGTCTSGSFATRTITTEVSDAGGFGSVASNQITLAAGTYEIWASAPALVVDNHQARLRNITDGTTPLVGSSAYSGSGNTNATTSIIVGRFTIVGSKVFEVQHRCQTTKATNGFGDAANFGEVEIYTIVRLWKVG